PENDGALRAQLLGCLAQELSFQEATGGRRKVLSAEALDIARRIDDPRTLAYALVTRNLATFGPDTVHERLKNATEAIELAQRAGDRELAIFGYGHRAVALLELGDPDGARECMPPALALADELAQPSYREAVLVLEAGLEHLAGHFARAEHLALDAYDIGQSVGDPNAVVFFSAQIFVIRQD